VPWSPLNPPPLLRPVAPITVPWFGGYGYYPYYWSSYPYTYDSWSMPAYNAVPAAPVTQAPAPNGPPPIVPELPAEWTIEFPADAAVTLNGRAVEGGGVVRKLSSPPLKPGET